jgi:GNAT superfamily N-acetyltransferase
MYSLRQANSTDFIFLKALHEAAMRPYVEAIWGWDEAVQIQIFTDRFNPANVKIILVDGTEAGALAVENRGNEIFLSSITLLPVFQGKGIGSKIIETIKGAAARRNVPITLTVLKPNPAKSLYERLGFRVVREDEVRFFMVLAPP